MALTTETIITNICNFGNDQSQDICKLSLDIPIASNTIWITEPKLFFIKPPSIHHNSVFIEQHEYFLKNKASLRDSRAATGLVII